jgi:hypothetical protein
MIVSRVASESIQNTNKTEDSNKHRNGQLPYLIKRINCWLFILVALGKEQA